MFPFRQLPWVLLLLGLGMRCSAPVSSGAEVRPELKAWWQAFLRDEPAWEEYRESWNEGSSEDRYLLLESLYVVLIGADEVAVPEEGQVWQRARQELVYFGGDAIPFLTEAVRQLSSGERVDWVAADRVVTVLADLHATKELSTLLAEGGERVRYAALRGLSRRRDEEAVPALLAALAKDADWKIRAQAVDAVAEYRALEHVRGGLSTALDDPDPLVREKAAHALGAVRRRDVQRRLLQSYEAALAGQDARQAKALHQALTNSLRRLDLPRDPAQLRVLVGVDGELP